MSGLSDTVGSFFSSGATDVAASSGDWMMGVNAGTGAGAIGTATDFSTLLGPAMSIAGTVTQAQAQRQAGTNAMAMAEAQAQNAQVAANFEAQQYDYLAGQELAAGQAEAYQQRKQAALVASTALANAAASGATASDPTTVKVISDIYAQGAYQSALAMYEGEEQARRYQIDAITKRVSGQSQANAALTSGSAARSASGLNSISTLIQGGTSLLNKYGSDLGTVASPAPTFMY